LFYLKKVFYNTFTKLYKSILLREASWCILKHSTCFGKNYFIVSTVFQQADKLSLWMFPPPTKTIQERGVPVLYFEFSPNKKAYSYLFL
jgi:hypothetical protein